MHLSLTSARQYRPLLLNDAKFATQRLFREATSSYALKSWLKVCFEFSA